jgi:Fic family protein
MLLRAGYAYLPYASLESVIEDNKNLYYKALRRTQTTLKTHSPDWEPWLGFFLRCLKTQKANLVKRLAQEPTPQHNDQTLTTLSLTIVALLKDHERLTIAQIVEHTGANHNTVKVRLRDLVSMGRIKRHGKARSTWYSL